MPSRRGIVAAIGALLVAVAIGAVARDTSAHASSTTHHTDSAATVSTTHRFDAFAPIAPKIDSQKARHTAGLRNDFSAVALFATVLAVALALWLGRARRPLGSPHLIQSIVRGRSPPPLLVVL